MAFSTRRPENGQILLMRNGVVVGNYGDTRVSEADYGNGFKAALAAAQAGDAIVCGAVRMQLTDASCSIDNVRFYGRDTWITPTAATNYSYLVRLTGDECLWDGINFDGESQTNTGVGNGLRLESAHRCVLRNFKSNNIYGTAGLARGNGVSIYASNDVVLKDYYSHGVLYSAIQLYDSDRCTIRNVEVVDPDDRCFTWYNSSVMQRLEIDGFVGTTTTTTTQLVPFFNFNGDVGLSDCVLKNVQLHAYDHVSTGVLANDSTSRQMMKFQYVTRMEMDNCWFNHGVNSGTGYTKTVRLEVPSEGPAPEQLIIRNSRFAEGFIWGTEEQKIDYCYFDNCYFGERNNDPTFGKLMWRPLVSHWINRNCTWNVHTGAASGGVGYAIEPSTYTASTDRWEFHNPIFKANTNSSCYVFGSTGLTQLAATVGNHVFANPTFENSGSGTWYRSANTHVNLAMTTDKNGDMLFDGDSVGTGAGQYPDPGVSEPFFSGVAVPSDGKKIWNIRWPAISPSDVTEKGYVARNGEWVELT